MLRGGIKGIVVLGGNTTWTLEGPNMVNHSWRQITNIMTHKLGQIEKVGSNEQNSIDRTFLIHSFYINLNITC